MHLADAPLSPDYTSIGGQAYVVIDQPSWDAWLAWLAAASDLSAVQSAAHSLRSQLGAPTNRALPDSALPVNAPLRAEPSVLAGPLGQCSRRIRRALARTWRTVLGDRSPSTFLVLLMLLAAWGLQQLVSNSLEYGVMAKAAPPFMTNPAMWAWGITRAVLVIGAVVSWLLRQQRNLFRAIVIAAYVLTVGLALNLLALLLSLGNVTSGAADFLLLEAVFVAVSNILLFAVWYWIIDPPGIDEVRRTDEPWDFLFPQRASDLPHYTDWEPRATDYLFLAFTTTFAFSPTDTLPLTRRAKYLMMVQAAISVICISAIVGRAINILA